MSLTALAATLECPTAKLFELALVKQTVRPLRLLRAHQLPAQVLHLQGTWEERHWEQILVWGGWMPNCNRVPREPFGLGPSRLQQHPLRY
jgi:hypothetical protein